jgi:hypothetical protein
MHATMEGLPRARVLRQGGRQASPRVCEGRLPSPEAWLLWACTPIICIDIFVMRAALRQIFTARDPLRATRHSADRPAPACTLAVSDLRAQLRTCRAPARALEPLTRAHCARVGAVSCPAVPYILLSCDGARSVALSFARLVRSRPLHCGVARRVRELLQPLRCRPRVARCRLRVLVACRCVAPALDVRISAGIKSSIFAWCWPERSCYY